MDSPCWLATATETLCRMFVGKGTVVLGGKVLIFSGSRMVNCPPNDDDTGFVNQVVACWLTSRVAFKFGI